MALGPKWGPEDYVCQEKALMMESVISLMPSYLFTKSVYSPVSLDSAGIVHRDKLLSVSSEPQIFLSRFILHATLLAFLRLRPAFSLLSKSLFLSAVPVVEAQEKHKYVNWMPLHILTSMWASTVSGGWSILLVATLWRLLWPKAPPCPIQNFKTTGRDGGKLSAPVSWYACRLLWSHGLILVPALALNTQDQLCLLTLSLLQTMTLSFYPWTIPLTSCLWLDSQLLKSGSLIFICSWPWFRHLDSGYDPVLPVRVLYHG